MILPAHLPDRITIIAKGITGDAGARYGNREPAETHRYEAIPARVDDVSTSEDLRDRARTDTFYDVVIRPTFEGEALDFDANAVIVWHRADGDVDLELDGEPALLMATPRRADHFEIRARRSRG